MHSCDFVTDTTAPHTSCPGPAILADLLHQTAQLRLKLGLAGDRRAKSQDLRMIYRGHRMPHTSTRELQRDLPSTQRMYRDKHHGRSDPVSIRKAIPQTTRRTWAPTARTRVDCHSSGRPGRALEWHGPIGTIESRRKAAGTRTSTASVDAEVTFVAIACSVGCGAQTHSYAAPVDCRA